MFAYIMVLENHLAINTTGKADVESVFETYDADSVEIEVILQQYLNERWIDVKSWNNEVVENLGENPPYFNGEMNRLV